MEKNALGRNWVLGETIITGIGQGFIQTTPIQLCLMTAQIANGGYKIYPKIVANDFSKPVFPTFNPGTNFSFIFSFVKRSFSLAWLT